MLGKRARPVRRGSPEKAPPRGHLARGPPRWSGPTRTAARSTSPGLTGPDEHPRLHRRGRQGGALRRVRRGREQRAGSNVGTDDDTGVFAVESIRRWWSTIGSPAYPDADRLLITADSGGSNGSRLRLWKTELAALAAETGLAITVCHLPPGTSQVESR